MMTPEFNAKCLARSVSKLMSMSEQCLKNRGGAIHAERLADYASDEFGKLTLEQSLQVLARMDKNYDKKLLRDGSGTVIGYAHSKKLFIKISRDDTAAGGADKFARLAKRVKEKKK